MVCIFLSRSDKPQGLDPRVLIIRCLPLTPFIRMSPALNYSAFCYNNKNFPLFLFFVIIIILKSSPQRFSLPISVWFVATVDQYLLYELPMRKQKSSPNCSVGLNSSVCFLVRLFLIHCSRGLQWLEGCLWP